ncbi:MAG TPA: DUF3352 domain-containing protein [Candidatus Limnocylindria bacterium]|nr:DUF3352 domain-containing protein [Candidatus Limnocylindria bacterium]
MSAPPFELSAAPSTRSGGGPWSAVVVGLTALLAVGIGGVLASFLISSRDGPGALAMADSIPADAAYVLELRLDLPGGQSEALEQLLARFPAEASDAVADENLERWIDEQLEQQGIEYRFATDVKPWFDGRVTFAVLDMPSMAPDLDPSAAPQIPAVAVLIGARDPDAARDLSDRLRADAEEQGVGFRSETYEGVEILSQAERDPASGIAFAWAIDADRVVLGTDAADVKEVLDVAAGRAEGIGAAEGYDRVAAALPADAAASVLMNTPAFFAALVEDWRGVPELEPVADLYERIGTATGLMGGTLRIEPDGARVESAALFSGELPVPGNEERGLDARVPGDAIFFADWSGFGELLAWYITALKDAMPDASTSPELNRETIADVEAAIGGDLESFVSWIDAVAIVAGWDGSQPYGGLILTTDDPDAARERIGRLRALGELAAGQAGITITDEPVGDVVVTTIRLPWEGGDPLPIQPVLQYAIEDDRVVIGVGDRFVARVLALADGDSLAASERYLTARDAVGDSSNQAVVWLDFVALREAIETNLPPDMRQAYDAFVSGWVEPLDHLVQVSRADGELSVSVAEFRVR